MFKNFVKYINNHFNISIKKFVLDNGGEYIKKKFQQILLNNDILCNFIPVYNYKLNEFTERYNKTITAIIKFIIIKSGLPSYL